MQITTFYSYKGGVGRTLACANFGLYLAKTGRKVVLADMDFEAPGLDSKFEDVSISEIEGGLIDQFLAFQTKSDIPDIQAIDLALPKDVAEAGGSLHLVPAGNYVAAGYYKKLSTIRWDKLLRSGSGLAFCLDLVGRIENELEADVLVIDARTGLSEVGGLCTQVLPDTVVLLTSTNKESLEGTKRIYGHISNSPIVKNRTLRKPEVDLRIVVTRIPRPPSLPELKRELLKRLDMPIERLYYLFNESDLSLQEYLALDRFEDHPAILDDYVELFASLGQEETLPYIEERLESFRSQLTRRPVAENERIIQELLTLFPRSEVILEAARYYRLAKDGDEKSVTNYIRFLDDNPNDAAVLAEFSNLCTSVSMSALQPEEKIVQHLRAFGAPSMEAKALERFQRLSEDDQDMRDIIMAIENDGAKISNKNYRETFFNALHSLREWKKILDHVSEHERRSKNYSLLRAEAYANVGSAKEAIDVLAKYDPENSAEVVRFLRILYTASPDKDFEAMKRIAGLDTPAMGHFLRRPSFLRNEVGNEHDDFLDWVRALGNYVSNHDR